MSEMFDKDLLAALHQIADEGIQNAARGFSGMIGQTLTVTEPSLHLMSIFDIPSIVGGLEREAIGVYLRAEGNLLGQIMMIIPYEKALELVDLLMCNEPGTTVELNRLERSALAEVGNQCGTFFLNSIASLTKISVRPTPPAVIVDMLGAIMDIVVASSGGVSEKVLLMQANILNGDRSVEANFWMIPDVVTLQALVREMKAE